MPISENSSKVSDVANPLFAKYRVDRILERWLRDKTAEFKIVAKRPPGAKRALLINHDFVDAQDRRVTQLIPLLEKRGYTITILCLARPSDHAGRADVGFNINPLRSDIPAHAVQLHWKTSNRFNDPLLRAFQPVLHPLRIVEGEERWIRGVRKFYRKFPAAVKVFNFFFDRPNRLKRILREIEWNPNPLTDDFIETACSLDETFELVVAADLPSLPTGVVLKDLFRSKLIYDSHELYPEQVGFGENKQIYFSLWERWAIKKADLAFTTSSWAASFLTAAYKMEAPFRFFTNATADKSSAPQIGSELNRIRSKLGVSDAHRLFLYNGSVSKARNVEPMIRAFNAIDPTRASLIILGYGELEWAKTVAAESKLGNVHVFPAVDHNEMVEWVLASTAILIPYTSIDHNTRICTPNKLFDAIEFERPLIANQELTTLAAIFNEFGIGRSVNFDTSEKLAADLSTIVNSGWLDEENHLGFTRAKASLGWDRQVELINQGLNTLGV